jgi:hypothetical protein
MFKAYVQHIIAGYSNSGYLLQIAVDGEDLHSLAIKTWAETKLRNLELLSRELKTYFPREVSVSQQSNRESSVWLLSASQQQLCDPAASFGTVVQLSQGRLRRCREASGLQ